MCSWFSTDVFDIHEIHQAQHAVMCQSDQQFFENGHLLCCTEMRGQFSSTVRLSSHHRDADTPCFTYTDATDSVSMR